MTLSTEIDQISNLVSITVSDNGPGIREEIRENLFNPFISTKGPSGTGLGLAIVEKNVMAHEGRIKVSSKEGEGCAFQISLPINAKRRVAREVRLRAIV